MRWHKTKRLLSWFAEMRLLFLAIIYVLLAFSFIWFVDCSEKSIRLVGLGLQVLGIGTVIWGISVTRNQFGHPPALSVLTSWFRRFPLIRRTAFFNPEGITTSVSLTGIRLNRIFTPDPYAPLEERLAQIEQGLETLQKRIGSAETELDNKFSTIDGKLLAEAKTREAADKEVLSALEVSSTGGVSISAVGALWLFVGVVLSTASQELTKYLT